MRGDGQAGAGRASEDAGETPGIPTDLFVATRPGQLRHITAFIECARTRDNRLMIMVTERDETLLRNMRSAVPDGLFSQVEVAMLPNFPTSRRWVARRRLIYRAMEEALGTLGCTDRGCSVNLNLCHPDSYYPYLTRIVGNSSAQTGRIRMLEEGLSTYKWGCLECEFDEYGFPPPEPKHRPDFAQDAKRAFKRMRRSKKARKTARASVSLCAALASWVLGRDVRLAILRFKDSHLPEHLRFGIIPHFDEGWFCFPDKMTGVSCFEIEELHALPMTWRSLSRPERDALEGLPDVMFVCQKYGSYGCYFEALLSVFEEMGVESVYVKLHPREDPEQVLPHLERAEEEHPGVGIVLRPELDATPLESLAATGRFRMLIGLTSTALLYVRAANSGIESVSISNRFVERYLESYLQTHGCEPPMDHLRQLKRDMEIFALAAADIAQFEPDRKGERNDREP